MSAYQIKFKREGLDDVKALSKNVRNALRAHLKDDFIQNPVGCSYELRDQLKGFRSHHWDKYRVVFKIVETERLIVIVAIDERSAQSRQNVYRRLEVMAARGELADNVLIALRGFSIHERTRSRHPQLVRNRAKEDPSAE